MAVSVRSVIREKADPYTEYHLANPDLSDEQLLEFMVNHPILINRPIIITEKGTQLCRPAERVKSLLP